eukprot:5381008-Pyramimonas_sp.AAC.1
MHVLRKAYFRVVQNLLRLVFPEYSLRELPEGIQGFIFAVTFTLSINSHSTLSRTTRASAAEDKGI